MAVVIITSGDGALRSGVAIVQTVAPDLLTANGEGVAAARALRIKADGLRSYASATPSLWP